MDCPALNLFCFICDHKFTDQEIINDQFNICCNPNCNNLLCDYCDVRSTIMIDENNVIICNCNNVIEIMNNMDIVTALLTDDNYEEMEITLLQLQIISLFSLIIIKLLMSQ